MQDTIEPKISERRKYERFSASFPAKFKDTRDDFGKNVYLRNASAGGILISSREKLYANDHVFLEVELPDNHPPMEIRGEVAWARQSQPNVWDAGLILHKVDLIRMSRLYKFTLL